MPAARIAGSLALLALIALTLPPARTSAGGIIYVDGGDSCGGNTPCYETIQEAVNNASPLTDILVFPGTYAESVNLSDMGSAIGGGEGRIGIYAIDETGEFAAGLATIDPGAAGGPNAGPAIFNEGTFGGAIEIGGFIVDSPDLDGLQLKTGDDYIQIDAVTADSVGDGNAIGNDGSEPGAGDDAFDLQSSGGDIGVSNSVANGASSTAGDGFDITTGSGGIFISNSSGADNLGGAQSQAFDLETTGGGPVVIDNSTATGTSDDGFRIDTDAGEVTTPGSVMITGSASNGNGGTGFTITNDVHVVLGGAVTIIDAEANGNMEGGFVLDNIDGAVELDSARAAENGGSGFRVNDDGNSGQTYIGPGPVDIANSNMSGNEENGFEIGAPADVSIADTTASGNGEKGVDLSTYANVTIDGLSASDNGFLDQLADGIEIRGLRGDPPGVVKVVNSYFADNADAGLVLEDLIDNSHEVFTNVICGNPGVGLKLDGPAEVFAPSNWWGDASGPTHSGNPGGTGDVVDAGNGTVAYAPWIEKAVHEILPLPAGDVPVGQFAALRVRFVDANDLATLSHGPGDPNGPAPFEISTDHGTLMSQGDEGDTVGGYLVEGFLNLSFVGAEEGIATVTVTGPCGLAHEFEIGVSFAGPHGDVDCDGDVDSVDALKLLQHIAGLDPAQAIPCQAIAAPFADIDCDGDVDSVDALQILRHLAGLNPNQMQPCRAIGV